jgi:hypothetical protein
MAVNNELEIMWKHVIVVYLQVYSGDAEKNHAKPVKIFGDLGEVRIGDLRNIKF